LVDFDADPDAGVQSAARHQPCEKSNMTVFLTVLSGVLFFVLGQVWLRKLEAWCRRQRIAAEFQIRTGCAAWTSFS
jgi:hypothetical protein